MLLLRGEGAVVAASLHRACVNRGVVARAMPKLVKTPEDAM